MLAIRFARVGRKKKPLYRLVVSEKTKDTYGDSLEILGTYNPHSKESVLKTDRIKHWLSVGAQASASVNNLFIKEELIKGQKAKSVAISNKRKAKMAKGKGGKDKADTATKDTAPKEEVKTESADASKENTGSATDAQDKK